VEDVLKNAARAGQGISSASFQGEVTFDVTTSNGHSFQGIANLEGEIQDGGTHIHSIIDADMHMDAPGVPTTLAGEIEVIATPLETFLRLHSLSSEEDHPLTHPDVIGALKNQWWVIADESAGDLALLPVTPDPAVLQAQAEVVSVLRDRGFAAIRGRRAYHYETSIDHEKLTLFLVELARERGEVFDLAGLTEELASSAATGELWIDAETFVLHRVQWTVTSLPLGTSGSSTFSFTIDIFDHNHAPPIELPDNAVPLDPIIGTDASILAPGTDLPSASALEEQIIEKMLQEGVPLTLP
jgi:hypothetical protein